MMSQEQARATQRSTIWIARHIDLRSASDRELLQIIAQQPVNVWQGSARVLAARWEARRRGLPATRWEARRRGLPATIRQASEEADGAPPVQAPQPQPRKRYVQQSEPDALLVSLLLDDPGAPDLPTGRGD